MGVKRTIIEVLHDVGYGDDLLRHINVAMGGKDMKAERIIDLSSIDEAKNTQELIEACKMAITACRKNLAMYQYKDELALADAFQACKRAVEQAEKTTKSNHVNQGT